ncbi:MAG TPA: FmdE family protein [Dissulfurispiraceae bacterium]|nr:FmdE family protein [Dissulfurispiraceae bacterium]
MNMLSDFEALLKESTRVHGHLCPGQVLGVRMSLLGLDKIGVTEPRGIDRKKIIIFVEMDRCATDAIQSVTGCSLGHRTMKFLDYGKMAATFVNLISGKAIRVSAREDARAKAKQYFAGSGNKYEAQIAAYKAMSDQELFNWQWVQVTIDPQDMPGRPLGRVQCELCGENVLDMREVKMDGHFLCRPCAEGGYYKAVSNVEQKKFLLPIAMRNSHNAMTIRSKVWLEIDGEPVFGRGRRLLLEAVDTHGSINMAAKAVSMSYKKAWSHIKIMEERLGIKLVDCRAGGKNGGGANLTAEAKAFLRRYASIENGIDEFVDDRFVRNFPVIPVNQVTD